MSPTDRLTTTVDVPGDPQVGRSSRMFPRTGLTRFVSLTVGVVAAAIGLRAESSLLGQLPPPPLPTPPPAAIFSKLDPLLLARMALLSGQSPIVATANDGVS